MRGIVEARCPECGEAFDPVAPPTANVPWFHRRRIGPLVALWRTLWMATLATRSLVDEVRRNSTLDRDAATLFRWICVAVAACSTALAIAIAMDPRPPMLLGFAFLALPMLMPFHLAAVLVDARGFESPGRVARFEILHDFTAAPLLFMPIVPIASGLFRLANRDPIAAILPAGVIIVAWFGCKLWYQTHAAGRVATRRLMQAVLIVMVWGSFAAICFLLTTVLVVFSRRLTGW